MTPSFRVTGTPNIYSTSYSDLSQGTDFGFRYWDGAWGYATTAIGAKTAYDSCLSYDGVNPTLAERWAIYGNITQVLYNSSYYQAMAAAFEALDTLLGDGVDDGLIWDGVTGSGFEWEDCWLHFGDSAIQFSAADPADTDDTLRTINVDSLTTLGKDSLTRVCIFSADSWRTTPDSVMYPNGNEQLTNVMNDTALWVIRAAMVLSLDSSSVYIGTTNNMQCFGIDNMYIDASGSACRQTSYWQAEYRQSWGGSHASHYEWAELGDIEDATVYDTLPYQYIRSIELLVDTFDTRGYQVSVNTSNTYTNWLYEYNLVMNDSVGRCGGELRGNDLTYYAYGESAWNNVVNWVDTAYAGQPNGTYAIEYRIVANECWCGDIEDTPCSCDPADNLTRSWGAWQFSYSLASFLWVQHYDHTMMYFGRSAFTSMTVPGYLLEDGAPDSTLKWSKRWWGSVAGLDLGEPIDNSAVGRLDSLLWDTTGAEQFHVLLRVYDNGVAGWIPNNSGDTSLVVEVDLGKIVDLIYPSSTDQNSADTTHYASGIVEMRPEHGYIWMFGDQAPVVVDRTADSVAVGDATFQIIFGLEENYNICSLETRWNGVLQDSNLYSPCIPVSSIPNGDTVISVTPVIADTGSAEIEIQASDDSSHVRYDTISVEVYVGSSLVPILETHIGGFIDTVLFPDTIFYGIDSAGGVGAYSFDSVVAYLSIDGGATYPTRIAASSTAPTTDTLLIWNPVRSDTTAEARIKLMIWSNHPEFGTVFNEVYSTSNYSYIYDDTSIAYFGGVTGTGAGYSVWDSALAVSKFELVPSFEGTIYGDSVEFFGKTNYKSNHAIWGVIYTDVGGPSALVAQTPDSGLFTAPSNALDSFVLALPANTVLTAGNYFIGALVMDSVAGNPILEICDTTVEDTYYKYDAAASWGVAPSTFPGDATRDQSFANKYRIYYHIIELADIRPYIKIRRNRIIRGIITIGDKGESESIEITYIVSADDMHTGWCNFFNWRQSLYSGRAG